MSSLCADKHAYFSFFFCLESQKKRRKLSYLLELFVGLLLPWVTLQLFWMTLNSVAPPAHPKVTWSFWWFPGRPPHLSYKVALLSKKKGKCWTLYLLVTLRIWLANKRIFAHQRTTFPVPLFRTDDNDRLNGVVKEQVLVAGLFGVPWQPS